MKKRKVDYLEYIEHILKKFSDADLFDMVQWCFDKGLAERTIFENNNENLSKVLEVTKDFSVQDVVKSFVENFSLSYPIGCQGTLDASTIVYDDYIVLVGSVGYTFDSDIHFAVAMILSDVGKNIKDFSEFNKTFKVKLKTKEEYYND